MDTTFNFYTPRRGNENENVNAMPPVSQINLLEEQSLVSVQLYCTSTDDYILHASCRMMKSRQDSLINHRLYQQPVMLMSNIYMVPHTRKVNFPRVDNAMNLTMRHIFCRPTMSPRQG